MKRREKKLSVMDWVLVGLLDTLAGVVAGGLMAIWQLPSAYRWRGYWAIGGEWLLVIIAIIVAVRLTHAFQMYTLIRERVASMYELSYVYNLDEMLMPLTLIPILAAIWPAIDPIHTLMNNISDLVGTMLIARQLDKVDMNVYNS